MKHYRFLSLAVLALCLLSGLASAQVRWTPPRNPPPPISPLSSDVIADLVKAGADIKRVEVLVPAGKNWWVYIPDESASSGYRICPHGWPEHGDLRNFPPCTFSMK